jgi:WD40 repeat protein
VRLSLENENRKSGNLDQSKNTGKHGQGTKKPRSQELRHVHSGSNTRRLSDNQNKMSFLATTCSTHLFIAAQNDGNHKEVSTAALQYSVLLWDAEFFTLESTLAGHTDDILCMTFTVDGSRLVTGSADHSARVWDIATSKALFEFKHSSPVTCVCFNTSGNYLLTLCRNGKMHKWHIVNKQRMISLKVKLSCDGFVCFNNSNQLIIGCDQIPSETGYEQVVKCWHHLSGQLVSTLRGHTDIINSVAVSPTEDNIATGSADKTIIIWDIPTGAKSTVMKGHLFSVRCVAYNCTGDRLASGSNDMSVKIWRVSDGLILLSMRFPASIVSVSFSTIGGDQIAVGLRCEPAAVVGCTDGSEIVRINNAGGLVCYSPAGFILL